MDQSKAKNIIKILKEISFYIIEEKLMNIINQIVNITSQIVEFEKYSHVLAQLKTIKNNINNIYTLNLANSQKIHEIIDSIKELDISKKSLKHSTTGEFTIIKKYGKDIIKFKSGDEYEGELKNNIYEGRGIYYYNGGDRYEGEYKNGKKEGKGIYYYKEGDRYEGEFKNDKREGRGIYYLI